jgi:hypothetical protein
MGQKRAFFARPDAGINVWSKSRTNRDGIKLPAIMRLCSPQHMVLAHPAPYQRLADQTKLSETVFTSINKDLKTTFRATFLTAYYCNKKGRHGALNPKTPQSGSKKNIN